MDKFTNKLKIIGYLKSIKRNSFNTFSMIINPTIINNPFVSKFAFSFYEDKLKKEKKILLFLKNSGYFYIKQLLLFVFFIIGFFIHKIYYKKQTKYNRTIIDIFFLLDKINKDNKFSETYLKDLYPNLDRYNIKYTFLARLYGANTNPFKLIKFFKIINNEHGSFLFEYDLISFIDLIKIFYLILKYPFDTLKLLQKENTDLDILFNIHLLKDIKNTNFECFTRYIFAKRLVKKDISTIYSWSEFQAIERSFNYGIRSENEKIRIVACQLFINYDIYFNTCVDDIDYELLSSPHEVMVNGQHYLQDRKKVKYKKGVSFRYKKLFEFSGIKNESNILVLGSYIEDDTKNMLESVKMLGNVIFKPHPVSDLKRFDKLQSNITVSKENIYKLFKETKIVISSTSGTALEAVACGISVIIVTKKDGFVANPLVQEGKGKIWDIAFSKDDITLVYSRLINYRNNNSLEVKDISQWYKDNFFIEPTEENIIKAFELDKG